MFEADTAAGKFFDVALLIAIILSVVLICLESLIPQENPTPEQIRYLWILNTLEWIITILFTIEYILRIISVEKPLRYIFSFFGIVDLLSIMPSYISVFIHQGDSLGVIRSLRLLRAFRVYKLVWLMSEADEMWQAILRARGKVIVFVGVVFIAVTIAGTAMYEIEGRERGLSVPDSMYWAVITLSTVGYGDIAPETPLAKAVAVVLVLLGYSLIIVPTGFVSTEFLSQKLKKDITTQACPSCIREGHDADAKFCKYCSAQLNPDD